MGWVWTSAELVRNGRLAPGLSSSFMLFECQVSSGLTGGLWLYFAAWSLFIDNSEGHGGGCRWRERFQYGLAEIRRRFGRWCGSSLATMSRCGSGRRMWLD